MKKPKIICIDFDGVIHSYTSGWQGPRNIPDPPVPGAIEWIEEFIMLFCAPPESIAAMAEPGKYRLFIYSSRSRYPGARRAMKKYLLKHGLDKRFLEVIKFPTRKPPAHITIDDRAICFTGQFPSTKEITEFLPWFEKLK